MWLPDRSIILRRPLCPVDIEKLINIQRLSKPESFLFSRTALLCDIDVVSTKIRSPGLSRTSVISFSAFTDLLTYDWK